jgi:septum site-determining protein MinD
LDKIITLHSYKGGTGKTFLAIALAQMLAMKGRKVCLLDLDFRAPNIGFAFGIKGSEYWLNDYLNGVCDIERVLIDVTDKYWSKNKGQLLVGPANPNTEAIRDMSSKDRKWEMRSLGRLLALKNSLLNNMGMDYLIFDASSGLSYSSINAVVASDIALVINTIDRVLDEGTQRMVRELYDLFDKKAYVILNKVPIRTRSLTEMDARLRSKYEKMFALPILASIPCFCEILEAGVTNSFIKVKPNHLFTKLLEEIALEIDSLSSGRSIRRKDSEIIRMYEEQFIKKVTGVRL